MIEQNIRFCSTSDGVRIAYATVGNGPPLVKAANWMTHLEYDWRSPVWRHWLEALAAEHTLVRYDGRGTGLSDRQVGEISLEAFVRDLEGVVDALGLDRFPLLGISQGGAVAVSYAARHPEKVSNLLLYGAYPIGWAQRGPQAVAEGEALLSLIRQGWGIDNPAYRQVFTSLFMPDAASEQVNWFNELQRLSTSPENAARIFAATGQINVTGILHQLTMPTLVLHCRDEVRVPFEQGRALAVGIPQARFVSLEGRNHLPQEGEPAWEAIVQEVHRFIGQNAPQDTKAHAAGSGSGHVATRTFMFTDVAKSTDLLSAIGDEAWEDVRNWHDKTLRTLFLRFGGEEVDHAGDGFFVCFQESKQALSAAIAIQRALAEHRRSHGFAPQVRIGLYEGQARKSGRRYSGKAVHEAARVAALANAGEILVAGDLLTDLAARKTVKDERELRLKGLSTPVRVAALDWQS